MRKHRTLLCDEFRQFLRGKCYHLRGRYLRARRSAVRQNLRAGAPGQPRYDEVALSQFRRRKRSQIGEGKRIGRVQEARQFPGGPGLRQRQRYQAPAP